MSEQWCSKRVPDNPTPWNYHACLNHGKVQDSSGAWFCGVHSPEADAKRRAKRLARYGTKAAERAAERLRLQTVVHNCTRCGAEHRP